jgi:phosphonate transport system substrate-binding protein
MAQDNSRLISKSLLVAATMVVATGVASAQQCKNPSALVFSIIPTEETTQEVNLYKPLIDTLKKNTGKRIEFYMPTSYASVVEALVNGWVQLGVLGPESYVIAKKKEPSVEVFATYAKNKGHLQEEGPGYRSVLITTKASGLSSSAQIKGKVLGLVEPASTSGDLIPRALYAKELGSRLEDYFSKVVYTGGHDLATLAVKEGRVDAAFVATHRFDNVVDRKLVKLEDFNVLWKSPVVPQDPFVYRSDLCQPIKQAIADTFLKLHEDPETKKFLEKLKTDRFVKMSDSDYDVIRQAEALKEAVAKK